MAKHPLPPSALWQCGHMSSTACVFCDLLTGDGEVAWVARRAEASAFLPFAEDRLSPAHTLVVPHQHAVGIHDVSAQSLQATVLLAQEFARAMSETLGAPGANILNASGPHSGQSVPHLHLHVVPRWEDDGLDTWPSTISRHPLERDWLTAVRTGLADRS